MKKILIGADNFWHSPIQIGCHQYARQFAGVGYQVGFISGPISPFHLLSERGRKTIRERAELLFKGGQWVEDSIWTYVPFALLPIYNSPVLRSRWVLENSYRFMIPALKQVLAKNGFGEVDVLWINSVSYGSLLDLVGHKTSILRITDNTAAFSSASKSIVEKEKELIQKVGLVIVTAELLKEKIEKIRPEGVVYVPNGVDFDHFYLGDSELPEEFRSIPSPRVIYVGSIEKWFDIDLVEHMASELPGMSFVIIGSPNIDLSRLTGFPNVYFLGKRDYSLIPKYLKNSDVGIIPFKYSELTDTINPIKLYEYMACGLPVVSVKWKELEYIKSPAILAESYDEFVEAIKHAIRKSRRPEYVEYARNNSWENRFNKISGLIEGKK